MANEHQNIELVQGLRQGIWGSATKIPVLRVDGQGKITGLTHIAITKVPPGVRRGDILVFDGTQWKVKTAGSNGQVLTVDTLSPDNTDLAWTSLGALSLPQYIKDELLVGSDIGRHKVFDYDADNLLVSQDIFTDNTLTVHLYRITYTYTNKILTQIDYTNMITTATWVKQLHYDSNGKLLTLNVT